VPARPHTSNAALVAAARAIVRADGVEALTMQRVAQAVGVRAPSLYKRVEDRAALVRLVADEVAAELTDELDAAAARQRPDQALRALLEAFRRFARAHPKEYALLFDPRPGGTSTAARERSSATVLRVVGELVGADEVLPAARTVVAWASGFLAMELAGAFQLGGDVDEAWRYGLDHLVGALGGRQR
jgi:AcrR family transcriptional regulator